MEQQNAAAEIIAREKAALEKWNEGNPSGYLAIYSKCITYFDPYHSQRMDGFDTMENYYESIRGEVKVDRYEMLHPKVELCGESAVLSYNLISYMGAEVSRWNCTEVYRREENNEWKIIHNHWSLIPAEQG